MTTNDIRPAAGTRDRKAIVLFSGGQDSTTCLAWALRRYRAVETVGFDYGQRHSVELACRMKVLARLRELDGEFAERLGDDHMLDMRSLGTISDCSLTREKAIAFEKNGLPNTFVPDTKSAVLHLRCGGCLPARRLGARRRHVRDGLLGLPRLPRQYLEEPAGSPFART